MTPHEKAIEEMKEYLNGLKTMVQTPWIRKEIEAVTKMIVEFKD
jgi:hypothetical protein|tara:strand:- start:1201 stop:1332 length:132 start_codon:yes stop_codon:yes gene_type:complete